MRSALCSGLVLDTRVCYTTGHWFPIFPHLKKPRHITEGSDYFPDRLINGDIFFHPSPAPD